MLPSASRPGSTSLVRLVTGTFIAAGAVLAAAVWPAAQTQSSPMDLVVGRNVNMVSGQTLPNGDPYLQRQNEPSVAASTRNPLHLLAGANDYRTVDIPGNFDDGETGDAWLGVFKSFDGGERWQSTLLPGYPQDTSAEGMASPLKAYHAGADPVVRPGTNGLIYFAGLAFNRGEHAPSAIFVSRFVDNNNKENGDPIAYISTSIVASSTGAEFLDKPWMAVDVPRQGAKVCKISTTKFAPVLLPGNNSKADKSGNASPKAIGNITQQVRAGTMYVAWAALTTKILADGSADVSSRIMFSKSDDCGATWTKPVQISDPAHKVNQGSTIAIDPRTGVVHVAWRQFGLDVNAPDAMMSASSDASGKIGKPRKVHTFPTQRHEDQLLQKLQRAHRMGSAKELVSIKPYDSSTAGQRFRTNAYPTIAVDDESRIYLAWTERGYGGRPLGPGETPSADGDARIVLSTSRAGSPWTVPTPVDNEAFAGHQLMPSMTYSGGRLMLIYYDLREDASQVFGPFVDDSQITGGKRHTLDVRAVQAPKGDQPQFGASTRVSQYATRTLTILDNNGDPLKEQFQFNPPNLPMFQLGTVPFMGDYIDVAPAPAFVQDTAGAWIHNTANTTAPVFHAVWTDNRDVQQPKTALGWQDYTKPTTTSAAGASCAPVSSGIRNQNVYSARLTMGLVAGSPGNTKPLSNVPRSFVVFAQNSTYSTKAFRFTIERQPAGGQASFKQLGLLEPEPLLLTVDVKVAPRSMVTRTVYATSANAKEQVPVSVTEIGILDFQPVTDGLTARVILNPDISNPDISNPDISNPDISNPDISNAEVYNPDISNPDISNPDISNPDISNPDISNPDISNIVIANPDISNPDISNPDISNPDISNPDISNPDISNAVMKDGSLTDVTWTLTNEGNTTASFNVNLFLRQATGDAAKAAGIKTQLVVHKTYKTPAVDGCGVLKTQTQMVLVANVLNPEFKDFGEDSTFDPSNPDISNTTLWLEPGGEGKITLRIIDPDPTDAIDINPVEDVPTPVVQSDPVNTEDLADPTPEPPATPAPTDPPPAPAPDMVELAYLLPFVPTNTIVDQQMAPIVVRTIAAGLPRAGVQVTLAIATNPAGGRLSGVTTVLSDGNGDAIFTGLVIERAGVGYQLSASASAAGAMPIISAPFAIKAIPIVTAVWAGPIVYDGLLHPATCTVTGLNGAALGGAVVTYTSGAAPVNTGAYGATCTFAGDGLYEPGSDDATLTITKAGSTTSTTGGTFTYDGAPHGSVCTVASPSGVSLAGTITYTPGGTNEPVAVGEYAVQCEFAGDANHEASSGANTITITARAATVTAGGGSKVFGASDPALTPVTTSFLAADAPGITLTQTRAAGEDAGTYPVTAQATGGNVGNYAVTYAAGSFTITKASTTTSTTGGTFTYDGASHGSVCTVTSPSGASLAGTITYTPGGTNEPIAVGEYAVQCGFAGDANHDASSGANTITITARAATVTAGGGSKVFGASDPALTPVTTSFLAADAPGITLTQSRAAGENAGTYAVTAQATGGNVGNYAVTYAAGSFSITTASTTTSTTGGTFVYDGAPHGSVCTVTSPSGAALAGTITYTPGGTNEPIAVGEYAVQCEFAGDANHDASSGANTITITARAATVTAGGGSKVFGASDPALTPVTTTFLAADAPGITLTQSRAAGENAGTYPVTAQAAGGNVGNYAVTYAAGLFTITKASTTTTVTCPGGVAYTGIAHEVCSAAVTGAGGLNVAVPVTYANNTNAGVANANAAYGGDANHNGSNGGATFPIAPAFPVAVATGGTFPYDGQPHGGTCVVTGVNGEMLAGSSTYNPGGATAPVNPGTYTLTCSVAGGGNYMPATHNAQIVIQSPSLAGDWSGTYAWDCGPGRTGTASIALTINAPLFAGSSLSNGIVTYLGGTGSASISRFSGPVLIPDQFGNIVRITVPGSTGNYVNNEFNGTLTNPGVLTITGTTLNGDTSFVGDGGCSANFGPSGSFVITKTPSPFVVTTTADAGVGSLRDVMTLANATAGHDTIRFNIAGGGEQVIALASPLPVVGTPMALLGRTQPGYNGRPMVRVDGQGTGSYGFELQHKSKISGLSLTRFTQPAVLVMGGGGGSIVEFSHVGTDASGALGLGNNAGVMLNGTTAVKVRDNLISGNTLSGVIVVGGSANEIRRNKIGTGLDGFGVLSNNDNGITLYDGANGTIIDFNVISGNGNFIGANGWGIDIQQSGALAEVGLTQITNNIIGLDASGNRIDRGGSAEYVNPTGGVSMGPVNRGNAGGGIRVFRGSGTAIGLPGAGNTISGNTKSGVQISGPMGARPVLRGNKIGTDPTGAFERGNRRGVEVFSGSAANVGMAGPGNGNLISGNTGDGVNAGGNTNIQNNLVGVDATSSFMIGNGNAQLLVNGALLESGCCHSGITVTAPNNVVTGNVVGGSTANTQHPGIASRGATGGPNVIEDNFVGVSASGTPFPNGVGVATFGSAGTRIRRNTIASNLLAGVFLVEGTQAVILGDVNAADGNTIRNNGTGVIVGYNAAATDAGNSILSNRIYANTSLGIDLGWNGVTPNDGGDGDSGPNQQVNFPVLANATTNGGTTTVDFTFDGVGINQNHRIQVFASAACAGGGFGQGERLVGSFLQMTDGGGDAFGTLVLTEAVPVGQVLSATITDGQSNTSEFSACVTVAAPPPPPAPPAPPTFVGPAGGGGGTPFTIMCPSGSVAAALRGRAGEEIDRTELMCSPVLAGPALGAAASAGAVGGFGGTDYGATLTCPAGYAMTGIHGRAGIVRWGGNVVDTLGVTCTNIASGAVFTSAAVGDSWGTGLFGLNCPAGQEVVGIAGGQGGLLDRIGVYCSNSVPPEPVPTPASGAVAPGPAPAPQPSRPEPLSFF